MDDSERLAEDQKNGEQTKHCDNQHTRDTRSTFFHNLLGRKLGDKCISLYESPIHETIDLTCLPHNIYEKVKDVETGHFVLVFLFIIIILVSVLCRPKYIQNTPMIYYVQPPSASMATNQPKMEIAPQTIQSSIQLPPLASY